MMDDGLHALCTGVILGATLEAFKIAIGSKQLFDAVQV